MSEYLPAASWSSGSRVTVKVNGQAVDPKDLPSALTALQQGKLAQKTSSGLPSWALPVGALAVVGIAFFVIRKRRRRSS